MTRDSAMSSQQIPQEYQEALEEAREAMKEGETGKYWNCPECWWQGPDAPIDSDNWEISCPDCGSVLAEVPTP